MIKAEFPLSDIGVLFDVGLKKNEGGIKSWGLDIGLKESEGGDTYRIKSRDRIAKVEVDNVATATVSKDSLSLEVVALDQDDPNVIDVVRFDKNTKLPDGVIKELSDGWKVTQIEKDGTYIQTLTNGTNTMKLYDKKKAGVRGTELSIKFSNEAEALMELQQQFDLDNTTTEVFALRTSSGHDIRCQLMDKEFAYPHIGVANDEDMSLASYSQKLDDGERLPLFGHVMESDTKVLRGLIAEINGIIIEEGLVSNNVGVHGLTIDNGTDSIKLERWRNSLGNLSTRITQASGIDINVADRSILSADFWNGVNDFEVGFTAREFALSESDNRYIGERYMVGGMVEGNPSVSVLTNVVIANGRTNDLGQFDDLELSANMRLNTNGEKASLVEGKIPDSHKEKLKGIKVGYGQDGRLEFESRMNDSYWRLGLGYNDDLSVLMVMGGMDKVTRSVEASIGNPELTAILTESDIPQITKRLEEAAEFDTLIKNLYGGIMGREVVRFRFEV